MSLFFKGPYDIQRGRSSKVKRVVITSSAGAILREDPNPITLTETDWNDQSLEILKKYEHEGRKNEAPSMVKYRASKTLAERGMQCAVNRKTAHSIIAAAWEFVNDPENKSRISWDLVALNPPFVS